jgi:hypothetical protein
MFEHTNLDGLGRGDCAKIQSKKTLLYFPPVNWNMEKKPGCDLIYIYYIYTVRARCCEFSNKCTEIYSQDVVSFWLVKII